MRRLLLVAAAALAVAAPAARAAGPAPATDYAPPPDPTVQIIDRVPVIQLDDGAGGLPYLGSTTPYNAGDWEPTLRAFHDSGVYAREIAQIDALAARQLRRLRGGHHGRRRALVLDVDETALSNYTAIEQDDFTFGVNSRNEATDQIGTAIRPTLRLFRLARRRGLAVFFITGRGEAVRAPTAQNLAREGFGGYRRLILKPTGFTGTTVQYKAGARRAIERRGFRIVANVGDQFSDLAGGHARRAYKLPNPFYYLP